MPYKIMSDAGTNFISDKFKTFYQTLSIEQGTSSSYNHQSNGKAEACIKCVKRAMNKCTETNHI